MSKRACDWLDNPLITKSWAHVPFYLLRPPPHRDQCFFHVLLGLVKHANARVTEDLFLQSRPDRWGQDKEGERGWEGKG